MVCISNSIPCNSCSTLPWVNANQKKSTDNSSAQKPIVSLSIPPTGHKLMENPVLYNTIKKQKEKQIDTSKNDKTKII